MLVTGPDDSILLLVFIGFYPEAVLVFWQMDRRRGEAEGGRLLWPQQEQLLVFPVKLERQGTVPRRPDCQGTTSAFRSNQASTGWFISSVPVKLDMKRAEEGGGASPAGHDLSLVITATNDFPSRSTTADGGFGASGGKGQQNSPPAVPQGSRAPALFV